MPLQSITCSSILKLMIADVIEQFLGLEPDALDERVRDLCIESRRVDSDLAAALSVVDARRDFEADGHRSLHGYVKATVNCGSGEATRLVRRSRLVNEEAEVADAWRAGHIGTAQADRLARASQHKRAGASFRDERDRLLADAEHLDYTSFETVVARFELLADIDGAHADDRANIEDRFATVTESADGVSVSARGGDALQAAEMGAVFQQACQDEFDLDCEQRRAVHGDDAQAQPLARTARQRSLDALHRIFMSDVTVPADGKRPEPIVSIVIDAATAGAVLHEHGLADTPAVFTDADPALFDRRCETSSGTVIHPDLALAAMLTGRVRRAVVDASSVVIDLGRSHRLFTGSSRDAARLLVTRCSARGCDVPARFCDVDHLEPASENGPTNQKNGRPMCGCHNRHKHRARLRARRTANGDVRLIRPDGTLIGPAGERPPEWAEPDWLRHVQLVDWDEFTSTRPALRGHRPMPVYAIDVRSLADDSP